MYTLSVHIPFKRIDINRLNKIIRNYNKYNIKTDLYIYTKEKTQYEIDNYTNNKIIIVITEHINNTIRKMLKCLKDNYDINMFTENDMLVPFKALNYWLENKNIKNIKNYNLGFIRVNENNEIVDVHHLPSKYIIINNTRYLINDTHSYCGVWIYDKESLYKWLKSEFLQSQNQNKTNDNIFRFGMHFPLLDYYENTIIPTIRNGKLLHPDCVILKMNTNVKGLKFHKCII
tara:strand:+ start:733 stop:1425 length:693 start_codon:yes stop_codon:yes gene_type:complete